MMKWSNLQSNIGAGRGRAMKQLSGVFFRTEGLLDEWCPNFILVHVLGAAGHCPEVI